MSWMRGFAKTINVLYFNLKVVENQRMDTFLLKEPIFVRIVQTAHFKNLVQKEKKQTASRGFNGKPKTAQRGSRTFITEEGENKYRQRKMDV